MIHLGDVTKIDGAVAPLVDVIIGGSPCQDLSVAGKRAGLDGARSGLFMEQIRIIKEMRRRCENAGANEIRPRYFVWENVPGAFSSNGGEDFRTVLEEICRIVDERAHVPRPHTGGGVHFGEQAAQSWATGIRSHGECLTLNSGESPSVVVASHLSQILEDQPHPKYYLSAIACQGVLRRAERRGKELPPILKAALERQSASTTEWEAKPEASAPLPNKAEP